MPLWEAAPPPEPAVDLAMVTRDQNRETRVAAVSPPAEIEMESKLEQTTRPDWQIAKPHPVEHPTVIVRAQVPSLVVKRTTWHPDRTRREADLEVREGDEVRVFTLREREYLGPLEVLEIQPTGVMFLHDGVEILHRIGGGR